ncbi:MAG: amidohydrolase family protein [Dehalococcoidia bacterium]|nr:amidohydrolase family protein [Dehalococcoidia bacterium]
MKIDVHAHYYPLDYLEEIERLADRSNLRDQAWLGINERKVKTTPAMWSVDQRLAEMDAAGVDMQALSLSIPNVFFEDRAVAVALAQSTNEALADICRKHPRRFKALASLPLPHVDDAIVEMRRAVEHLGMHGLVLGSNINTRPLDSPEFMPLYEEADRLGLAIFIHPMIPMGIESLGVYDLAAGAGFLLDTTVAAARLAYSGVLERCRNLKVIIPHLGGVIPYIIKRLDNSYRTRPECRLVISNPPSHYLTRLYMDVVSFHQPALRCALDTVGAGQLLLGSDYPFALGSMEQAVASVKELGLPAEDEERVFSGNALGILR